jgi:hypothetical protein
MRMRSRTVLWLRLALLALAIAGTAVYVLRWPSGWSKIRLDLTRPQVVALVGPPTVDGGAVEGEFWVEQRRFAKYELWIAFAGYGRVSAFTIDRRVGTARRFYDQRLKGDLSNRFGRPRR